MTDITDAFVVSLGLDPSQYNDEMKKYRADRKRLAAEDEAFRQREQEGQNRTTEGLRKIRNETAGFLLMLAGANGLKQFVGDMLSGDAATGRFATNIGMATERVAIWEQAVKRAGGQAGEAQGALKGLFSIFQNYQLGLDASKGGALAYFGLSEMDLKDPESALLRISEVARKMPRADVDARLGTLGLGGSLSTLLSGDAGDLRKLLAEVEALGVATDADAEAAQALEKALAKISQTIKSEARPAVARLAEILTDFATDQDAVNTALFVGAGALGAIAIAAAVAYWPLFVLAGAIALVAKNWGTLKENWADFGTWWEKMGKATDSFFDPARQALGMGTGAELRGAPDSRPAGWLGGGDVGGSDLGIGTAVATLMGASPASTGPRGKLRRAERNNNPGNIEDGRFARSQPGYAGSDGRFARFVSAEAGFGAMETLLNGRGYAGGGRNTIAGIISKYAPSSENDVGAYVRAVEKQTGIGRNTALSAEQIKAVSRAMARHEGYRGGSVNLAAGASRLGPQGGRGGAGALNQSNVTTVGQINVYTPAGNAEGIVRDMRGEMAKRGLIVQAGPGLRP